MPVGNGGGRAIAITDTSDPAPPSCASGYCVPVRVIADVVGLKVRGVSGVSQHLTEGLLVANAPASKKLKQVYTTIALYVTGEMVHYYQEDYQYHIFFVQKSAVLYSWQCQGSN
jgi:hypothetical protein